MLQRSLSARCHNQKAQKWSWSELTNTTITPHPIQLNIYQEHKLSSVIKSQKSINNTQTALTVYWKSIIRMAHHLIY